MFKLPFIILLPISLLLLAAAVILTLGRFRSNKKSAVRLTAITLLAILSVAVIRVPIYQERGESKWDSTVHSVMVGIQTIGVGGDLDKALTTGVKIIDGQESEKDHFRDATLPAKIYITYCIIQYALCPLLCAFALTKTISSVLGRFWLRWFYRGPVFFFSDLTEESLLLAESIQKTLDDSKESAFICFAATEGKIDPTLEEKLPASIFKNVLCYPETICYLKLPTRASYVNCILCHPSEKHNLSCLMQLLEDSKTPAKVRMNRTLHYFIFAHSRHAEKVVDHLSEEHIQKADNTQNRIICMLNTKDNLAMSILNKHELFKYITRDDAGNGRLNVLIAGSTQLANHFLRNCIPCGQLDNCELKVTLADVNAEAYKKKLFRSVPMLANGSELMARCVSLHFETLDDPMAVAEESLLKDVNYVLLAYDDDKTNIQAAQQIQLLIERQKLVDPQRAKQRVAIVYNVEDPLLSGVCANNMPSLTSAAVNHCEMYPEGNRKQQFSVEVLFGDELLQQAFFVNCTYAEKFALLSSNPNRDELRADFITFMNKSYDRRQSLASALQIKYRKHVLANSPNRSEAVDLLTYIEHYRWSAFSMLDGFLKPTDEQLKAYFYTGSNTHRSLELSLHPCLVTSEENLFYNPYDPQAEKDPLDLVSIKVHELAVEMIRNLYANEPRLIARLEGDLKAGNNTIHNDIKALLPNVSESELRFAKRLTKAVFTDFKVSDRAIVLYTDKILRAAESKATIDTLRLFWLKSK